MTKIKFGTDGWRAIIAQTYTVDNVKRVAEGTAKWIKEKGGDKVVIGHDCRFGGQMFAEATARVFGAYGIKVNLAKDYVSTPMVSLGVLRTKSILGVVITASHNPPSYNGYKLKSAYGGPTVSKEIAEVEAMIPDALSDLTLPTLTEMMEEGLLNYIDLEDLYVKHVKNSFDLEAINNSGLKVAYDAMYGAGQRAMQRILKNIVPLHCDHDPGFKGQAPEPIHRNLLELSALIAGDDSINLGIANDGDADRIGMYDSKGNFVDSHHILLLLLHYLHKYKGMSGKVVFTFSVTEKMRKMAELYGMPYSMTKIGFKYIAEIMTQEEVLVGGEESGGLAVAGHIPERDGIWIGLLILEFMAKTGKSLEELIQEVYDVVGSFAFSRDDLHLPNDKKWAIMDRCKDDPFKALGKYEVTGVDHLDGYKFHLGEGKWLMIRPSGTEPVLRVYAQGIDMDEVKDILKAAHATLKEV